MENFPTFHDEIVQTDSQSNPNGPGQVLNLLALLQTNLQPSAGKLTLHFAVGH